MIQLEKFKSYLLNERDVSEETIKFYIRDIENYILFLQTLGIEDSLSATNDDILAYINELENIGRRATTVTRKIASIRSYYRYCVCLGEIKSNPTDGIKIEKPVKKQPCVLSPNEIRKLLDQPNVFDFKGYRDKAMLEVFYATGIRVSELVALDIENIDLKLGILNCRNSKNERTIPVCRSAAYYMGNYISGIRPHIIKGSEQKALFINMNGSRLTRQGFSKIVKFYAQKANISKKLTPHTLRYSFALRLVKDGVDIEEINQIMGHAALSSTQNYLDIIKKKL